MRYKADYQPSFLLDPVRPLPSRSPARGRPWLTLSAAHRTRTTTSPSRSASPTSTRVRASRPSPAPSRRARSSPSRRPPRPRPLPHLRPRPRRLHLRLRRLRLPRPPPPTRLARARARTRTRTTRRRATTTTSPFLRRRRQGASTRPSSRRTSSCRRSSSSGARSFPSSCVARTLSLCLTLSSPRAQTDLRNDSLAFCSSRRRGTTARRSARCASFSQERARRSPGASPFSWAGDTSAAPVYLGRSLQRRCSRSHGLGRDRAREIKYRERVEKRAATDSVGLLLLCTAALVLHLLHPPRL